MAAYSFATGAAKGKGRIDLVLDPNQRVEHHLAAVVQIDVKCVEPRAFVAVGIVAIDVEDLDVRGACRRRPGLATPDARLRCDSELFRNGKAL